MDLDSDSDLEVDPLASLWDDDSPKKRPINPLPAGSRVISLSSSQPNADSDLDVLSAAPALSSTRIEENDDAITRFANKFGSLSRTKVHDVLKRNNFNAEKSTAMLKQMENLKLNSRAGSSKPLVVPAPRKKSPPPRVASPPPPPSQSQRRGVESAIYANRKSLGGKGASGALDGTPKVKKEKRKEQKQDSGSEDDGNESDEYGGKKRAIAKWERDEEKEEADALVSSSSAI
jgi:hypothetical protein